MEDIEAARPDGAQGGLQAQVYQPGFPGHPYYGPHYGGFPYGGYPWWWMFPFQYYPHYGGFSPGGFPGGGFPGGAYPAREDDLRPAPFFGFGHGFGFGVRPFFFPFFFPFFGFPFFW